MKNLLFSIGFLVCVHCGCNKENAPIRAPGSKLPPATQEGKMTLGCMVDDLAWTPKAGVIPPPISVSYNEITGQFNLLARRNLEGDLTQYLSMYAIFKKKDSLSLPLAHSMWADTSGICPALSSIDPLTGIGVKEYWNTNGRLILTKVDFATGVISGIFEFDATSPECQNCIKISKGRFDIKYK